LEWSEAFEELAPPGASDSVWHAAPDRETKFGEVAIGLSSGNDFDNSYYENLGVSFNDHTESATTCA
jgi:hypothetical protein